MAELTRRLYEAAAADDLPALQDCLAEGVDLRRPHVDLTDMSRVLTTPLHAACEFGHASCAAALLAAGADPEAANLHGMCPLHVAANCGRLACVQLLLAAGAKLGARDYMGYAPMSYAALCGWLPVVKQLLAADPRAALQRNGAGELPLQLALEQENYSIARVLLEEGALPAARVKEVLWLLRSTGPLGPPGEPLYAALAARQQLTAAQWAAVPSPCRGLGAALPAVLARSKQEAAELVHRLPEAERLRLRTFTLCLARAQQRMRAQLPPPLVQALLMAAVAP
ncbi:hypothetical protein ABPG77_002570 [Micractinium sp. CCAP 211/92]